MKIKVTEYWDDYECEVYREQMEIDDKVVFGVSNLSECPEDARIGRDLTTSEDVIRLMKIAHEAGINGEDFQELERAREEIEDE